MLKMAGILFVVLGASGAGVSMAAGVRRTTSVMRQLLAALEQMKNEIAYRKTALPELMRILSLESHGVVAEFFTNVANDLCSHRETTAGAIIRKHLPPAPIFPANVRQILLQLGNSLGKYDVDSQLQGIELAISRLRNLLDAWQAEQQSRVRSYCTLGVCAGAAIAIIAL